MNQIAREWLLLRRSTTAWLALVTLGLLSAVAAAVGIFEIRHQRAQQLLLADLQRQETAVLARWIETTGDAGYAAYYQFHATWNPPAPLAFAALGFRDVAPQELRIRALGLEAQLYDNENFNPELALAGRFDLAFVIIYLAPLFLIALLHDLVSREREKGRLPLLMAVARNPRSPWRMRVLLRVGLACLAIMVPFWLGAAIERVSFVPVLAFTAAIAGYACLWALLARIVGRTSLGSAAHAAALVSLWAVLTLALPAAAQAAIARAVPVEQGVELTLAHRQVVHAAWDIPKEDTMRPFLETHPEWRDTPPVTGRFHWKWYFAFHQVGDQRVARQARRYREALLERQRRTVQAGWLLPSVVAQGLLHRLAQTDLPAQLAYEDRIRAYHEQLRRFYYPYLFEERRFGAADFERVPVFGSQAVGADPAS